MRPNRPNHACQITKSKPHPLSVSTPPKQFQTINEPTITITSLQGRRTLEREDSEDSPACAQCEGSSSQQEQPRCPHCELSETDDAGDLICFNCQAAAASTTTDDDEPTIPRLLQRQPENRSLDEESDETTTTTTAEGEPPVHLAERLATIVEAKGDTTASENDEEAPKRLNGTSRFLNYTLVLLL